MRILLALHTFFPHWRAGTEVYTLNLAQSFKESGHEIQLVCYEPSANASHELSVIDDTYNGLPVHRILFNRNHPDVLLHEYFNPGVEKHLIEFYRRVQPDLVHVLHSMHLSAATITAARRLGLPVVCTATDFWYICPTYRLLRVDDSICPGPVNFLQCSRCCRYGPSNPIWKALAQLGRSDFIARVLRTAVKPLIAIPNLSSRPVRNLRSIVDRPRRLREILRSVDMLIVPNENTYRVLTRNRITADRVMVLGFGLRLPSEICAAKSSSAKLRFAYIGTLDHAKGAHLALEALRRLSKQQAVELTVYGDPQANPQYFLQLQKIAGSDQRIEFAGTFPNDQIGEVFSKIDLLVIPSLWYENSPLVLYSAFASKTPAVASNIGSLADAIRHGENGLLFEMGNSSDLAQQIQRVLDDRSLLEKLRQGIPPVKPIEQNAQELLEIYATLSTHPAVSKPQIEFTSLSRWLASLRSSNSSTARGLGFFERVKMRSVFRRRGARFGEKLELCRCEYACGPRRLVDLRFVWRSVQLLHHNLTVVVQFLDKCDTVLFCADHQLGEAIADHGWRAKDLAAYSIPVQLPDQTQAGSYAVRLGVWDSSELQFLAPTRVWGWREESAKNIRLDPIRMQ